MNKDIYGSEVLADMHESAKALLRVGAISEEEMKEFDELCFSSADSEEITDTSLFGSVIETLEKYGARENLQILEDIEAPHNANVEAVAELLKKMKVDLNSENDFGYTPLNCAVEYNKADVVKVLLKAGADVNGKDEEGFTALHYAALHGHVELMKFLLDNGANCQIKDVFGELPIHKAVNNKHAAAVKILSKTGHDLNVENNNGTTPLELALGNGLNNIVKILETASVQALDRGNDSRIQQVQ